MNFKDLYYNYRHVISYLFFGGCTTIVNVVTYWTAAHLFDCGVMFSTVLAWIIAVVFAYVTNRKWVFHSGVVGASNILKEALTFFACRLTTGLIDWTCMFLFVQVIGLNDIIIKALSNGLVVILNFMGSKILVFRRKRSI